MSENRAVDSPSASSYPAWLGMRTRAAAPVVPPVPPVPPVSMPSDSPNSRFHFSSFDLIVSWLLFSFVFCKASVAVEYEVDVMLVDALLRPDVATGGAEVV